MKNTDLYLDLFTAPTPRGSCKCHLHAIETAAGVTLIATDIGEGLSVTNAAEYVHACAVKYLKVEDRAVVCIEHYPKEYPTDKEEHFDLVFFEGSIELVELSRSGQYGTATYRYAGETSWKPLFDHELRAATAERYSCDYYDRMRTKHDAENK